METGNSKTTVNKTDMIQVSNISFKYPGTKRNIFDNFSLDIEENKIYGLLGKNGTGKSTLLYLISGLLRASKGNVSIDGVDARERRPEILRDIFIVPEEFELPNVSLDTYVKINQPFYPNFSNEVLQKCLADFSLPHFNKLNELSMGQKKKVVMCFALATNASLLLMDGGIIARGKASTGMTIATDEWYEELERELRTLDYPRRIKVEPKEAEPSVTDADLAPVNTLLGSFSLSYDQESARGRILEKAAKALDQKIFRADSRLSFNTLMKENFPGVNHGNYTAAEQHALDILASCLYGSALHGGFMIAQREAGDGEFGVDGVPVGFVAFAHGRKEDLVLRNRFHHNAYIVTYAKDGLLTVDILGASEDLAGAEINVLVETVDDPADPAYAVTTVTRLYTHSGTEILKELVGEDRMRKQ